MVTPSQDLTLAIRIRIRSNVQQRRGRSLKLMFYSPSRGLCPSAMPLTLCRPLQPALGWKAVGAGKP